MTDRERPETDQPPMDGRLASWVRSTNQPTAMYRPTRMTLAHTAKPGVIRGPARITPEATARMATYAALAAGGGRSPQGSPGREGAPRPPREGSSPNHSHSPP